MTPKLQNSGSRGLTNRPRLESVDWLRGCVMVLMALDHTRDFFANATFNPVDLEKTTAAFFLTRWITHFCAPSFVFLAGVSAFLSTAQGQRTKAESCRRLAIRGLWLVGLDLVFFNTAWMFNFTVHWLSAMVLWAIGWSMVVLAGLVWMPRWFVLAFGLALIALHNAFDGVVPVGFGVWQDLWRILHAGGAFDVLPGVRLAVTYPLIPWVGVMAVGYSFGPLLLLESPKKQRSLLAIGSITAALFFLVRGLNLYGDPVPWTTQRSGLFTVLSFLRCNKYPPSLCFLLMTLGPSILALGATSSRTPAFCKPLVVIGRVPLFYYVLHIPLIHAAYLILCLLRFGRADWSHGYQPGLDPMPVVPANSGVNLETVYGLWILFVLALYPACRWFERLKRMRRAAWMMLL
jgi:uncharacterized membrane protein